MFSKGVWCESVQYIQHSHIRSTILWKGPSQMAIKSYSSHISATGGIIQHGRWVSMLNMTNILPPQHYVTCNQWHSTGRRAPSPKQFDPECVDRDWIFWRGLVRWSLLNFYVDFSPLDYARLIFDKHIRYRGWLSPSPIQQPYPTSPATCHRIGAFFGLPFRFWPYCVAHVGSKCAPQLSWALLDISWAWTVWIIRFICP